MEKTAGGGCSSGDGLPSSVVTVMSNDDLLTEILLRLPVLSLVLFKSVSKYWLSLIQDTSFVIRRIQFPNLNSPCGLFLWIFKTEFNQPCRYEFAPFDIRVPSYKTFFFDPNAAICNDFDIVHSCNGLVLCLSKLRKLYVFNPSVSNMFKLIPEPDNVLLFSNDSVDGALRMSFDPTKSPHYKVIYGKLVDDPFGDSVQIQTYSSETGNWSLCGDQFPIGNFLWFKYGVYWNDGIYWLDDASKYIKVDILSEHPVVTTVQTPLNLDGKVHYECRLFESHGCLLLAGKDDPHSRHFTIYEKKNVYSDWSLKYIVNLDDIMIPFPSNWSLQRNVFGIILGEREDHFLVLKLGKKVVQHKIMSKTLCSLYDLGFDDGLLRCFEFIPSFANV